MKKNKAFTLIEMIVVLMIVAIVLPAVFMILYNIMFQQVKLYKLTETRRQGDYTLSFMKEKILRDAKGVQDVFLFPVCVTAGPEWNSNTGQDFFIIDKSSTAGQPTSVFQFFIQNNILKYIDTAGAVSNVTSTQVLVEQSGATPFIGCLKKTDSLAPYIQITYKVTFNDADAGTPKETSLYYSTKFRLRNE